MSQESARLFLALWPDANVRTVLTGCCDACRWSPRAAVVPSENLHLTLHFIGNVPRTNLAALRKGLHVPFRAFSLEFGRSEVWHGNIAILRPNAVPEPLVELHAALAVALHGHGLSVETRKFYPHVTLARRCAGSDLPTPSTVIRWPVSEYVLMESCLSAKAAEYVVIERYSGNAP